MADDQFQRTRLLLGEAGLNRLRAGTVAIVGCGAVGGFAIEALARVGVGRLILIDGDTVQVSNINRQLCATHQTVGQPKTEVLRQRIADICPDTQVITQTLFLNADNADALLAARPDFVIDAIDMIEDKAALIMACQAHNIPLASSMGAALKTNPAAIRTALMNQTSVCPLAARLRRLLKDRGARLDFPCVYSVEHPSAGREPGRQMGSLITITGMFGLTLANLAIQFLTRSRHDNT